MIPLLKTIIEKERKRFAKIRTDAVSEMLDSPDEYGIFPTTELFRTWTLLSTNPYRGRILSPTKRVRKRPRR